MSVGRCTPGDGSNSDSEVHSRTWCEWIFNPPYASHFGGVWGRQIGTVCLILYAMLLEIERAQFTHELLVTLMEKVTGIVNSRPIATIPLDADEPQPLTPTMLLTMKTRNHMPPARPFPASSRISMRVTGGEGLNTPPTNFGLGGLGNIYKTSRADRSGRAVSVTSL